MEIKSLNLSYLRQEEAFGFHKLAKDETAKCTDSKLASLQQTYVSAFNSFDESLKQGGGENVLTVSITKQDAVTDTMYRGLKAQIINMESYFDPQISEIARQARLILNKYGDPTYLPYLEECGVLHNLIQELETFDNIPTEDKPESIDTEITTNRLQAINARGWLQQLKIENEKFLALFSERNQQQATIVTGASKANRQATDTAYRDVVKRINALAEVNGPEAYADVINSLNSLIARQQSILASRSTKNAKKKKGDDDKPDPIEPDDKPDSI